MHTHTHTHMHMHMHMHIHTHVLHDTRREGEPSYHARARLSYQQALAGRRAALVAPFTSGGAHSHLSERG